MSESKSVKPPAPFEGGEIVYFIGTPGFHAVSHCIFRDGGWRVLLRDCGGDFAPVNFARARPAFQVDQMVRVKVDPPHKATTTSVMAIEVKSGQLAYSLQRSAGLFRGEDLESAGSVAVATGNQATGHYMLATNTTGGFSLPIGPPPFAPGDQVHLNWDPAHVHEVADCHAWCGGWLVRLAIGDRYHDLVEPKSLKRAEPAQEDRDRDAWADGVISELLAEEAT